MLKGAPRNSGSARTAADISAAASPPTSGPPSEPGRRERRRAETRDRILRAAMQLFAERGFNAITVGEITEAADVGKGTFFNYFPSKEHVLTVLAERQVGKYARTVEMVRAGRSTCEALRWLYHALPEESRHSQTLVRSLFVAFLSNDEVRAMIRERTSSARVVLAEVFTLGQRRGEVGPEFAPQKLALWFQQALFGSVMMWVLHPPVALGPWLDASFEMFWAGLSARPQGKGARSTPTRAAAQRAGNRAGATKAAAPKQVRKEK
jgi:AcrR family transcriptional regulator